MSDWQLPDTAPFNTKVWIRDPAQGLTIGIRQTKALQILSRKASSSWVIATPQGEPAEPVEPLGWMPLGETENDN